MLCECSGLKILYFQQQSWETKRWTRGGLRADGVSLRGGMVGPGWTGLLRDVPSRATLAKELLREGDLGIVAAREQGDAGSIPGTGSSAMPPASLRLAQALGAEDQAVIGL